MCLRFIECLDPHNTNRGAPDAFNNIIFNACSARFCLENMARSINTNVSTSVVTTAERVIISELLVNVKEADACKKSFVWQYFGPLHPRAADFIYCS